MRSSLRAAAGIGMAVIPGILLLGCEKPPAARPEPPPAPVTVTTAAKKTVPIQLRAIGSVKTIATVSVRARVEGELTKVHFKEGDFIEAGKELFTIDPRPYEAAVKLAEANLKKNEATLDGADRELKRLRMGGAGGVVSPAELDAAETAVATATAAVAADKASINSAKIQAAFTTITAPISGRAGGLLVTKGNLISANDVHPLVVINQLSPIHVTFAVPEQQLPVITAAWRKGPIRVEADMRGGGPLAAGELAFIDNAVDPGTGTIQLKAEFKNENQALWPGLFVDVTVTLGSRPNSVVIPSAAVQTGQQGQYVYVVNAEKKAELRPVTLVFETDQMAVIESGLEGGETVVVEGQLRLAPGTKVNPRPFTPGKSPNPGPPPAVTTEGAK
jgi:multidrug efflux system membrane fusion protein